MDERIRALLPAGSIVRTEEPELVLMISAFLREVQIKETGETALYDYEGVLYPCGYLNEENVFLFNQADVKEVIFRGYEDKDREQMIEEMVRLAKEKETQEAQPAPEGEQ